MTFTGKWVAFLLIWYYAFWLLQ